MNGDSDSHTPFCITGVGPGAPTTTNQEGGRQSETPYRLDLLPALATLAVGRVVKVGADKYGEWTWKKIGWKSHLNHALVHAFAFLAGDRQDNHLEHATCRMMMALEMYLSQRSSKLPQSSSPTEIPETSDSVSDSANPG